MKTIRTNRSLIVYILLTAITFGIYGLVASICNLSFDPAKEKNIGYAPTYMQSLPFYGGNIIYHNDIETPDCDLIIQTSYYKGALVKVYLDGVDCGNIVFSPYKLKIDGVKSGKHKIDIKLFGNRINTFGGLHNTVNEHVWQGPMYFRSANEEWSYEYRLRDMGIYSAPVVTIIEK